MSMNRRTFLAASTAMGFARGKLKFNVAEFDRARVLRNAQRYLFGKPLTVTAELCSRSAGGAHDFYSEGDYWWPDPENADGPYIQRDGMTNPENFTGHRKLLIRLSVQVPALAAAWKLTEEQRYADPAAAHLRAWFVDEATRMNPNLQFAQAIHGRSTGRGTGIIDTIHLVEVARAIPLLAESGALSQSDYDAVRTWFASYMQWILTSANGMEERDAKNNHGTCWLMQLVAFARLTGNPGLLSYAAERFRKVIVPEQIAADGSLPLELKRTKPYGYCLFNLEALAVLCQILSESGENLWEFSTADGRGIAKAMSYMFPYIRDKASWPSPPDVMYYEYWPMRQASLLLSGINLQHADYVDVWKKLPADSDVDEVIRNFFIRQPILWV